jgi:hypothetical protein
MNGVMQRNQPINQLSSCGTIEDTIGRHHYELTHTELEEEKRWINMQREGEVIY